jgi:hypothetical protein
MGTVNDADWDRAFFAWLLGCLGIGPFLVGWWGTLWAGPNGVVVVISFPAWLLFSITLLLGHWPSLRPIEGEERWRMGRFGTVLFAILLLLAAWPTILYFSEAWHGWFH